MSSDQRETVLMIVHRTRRDDVPALDVVTLFAVGAHLPAMEIRMAISTAGARIGKNGFGVAACTSHIFVHPAQRIRSLVVIKFWNGSNRLPTERSVTVLAGHVQG